MSLRAVIVQEYVPHYRVPFFSQLRDTAAREAGIDIVVAAGSSSVALAHRNDAVVLDGMRSVSQRELAVLGRRLVVRDIADATVGADLVVLEQARRNTDVYRLFAPRRMRKVPVALWGHGRDFVQRRTRLEERLQSAITRRADWFFAYTASGRDAVIHRGFPSSRVTVVNNSTDTAALRAYLREVDEARLAALRQRLGLGPRTALFVGALDRSKRLHLLIDAAAAVARRDRGFRLVVVGDGEERSYIEHVAASNPFVKYIGRAVGKDLALLFAASDIIAMPGRVGLIAADSFASGRPIVTTNWSGHAPEFDYLESGRNAFVSPDTVSEYADALELVLDNQELRGTLVQGCRNDAERYTVANMADRFLSGIRRAIEMGTR